MSEIITNILRSEAGVHTAFPGSEDSFVTHCTPPDNTPKRFSEVLVHWDGAAWVEDPVFVIGQSKAALRVDNDCDATFAYLNMYYNDFRLKQLCCVNEVVEGGLLTEDGENILGEDGEPIIIE